MTKIEKALLDIGIPPSQRGFAYIADGLELIAAEPDYIYRICGMYERIGSGVGRAPGSVERAIRHAIETAFDRAEPETLKRYFFHPGMGKPTNSEFLATVALQFKEEVEA